MPRKLPIFYCALLLTGVNLLLRFAGTAFGVYLSGCIGAEGIGLLQLVMSVGSLATVAGIGGVRTATMYLTAEELGSGRSKNVTWVLSACTLYSIVFSGTVACALYLSAPYLAEHWIGNRQTILALRLFASFLPVNCLCGVMTGYFTAANRITTLAAVEVAEQICCMMLTVLLLTLWARHNAERACMAVILGSALGGCLTLVCLIVLRLREPTARGPRISVRDRLLRTALPLALADDLKCGINTTESLMVPRRLALCPAIGNPLAAFGIVSGMVFPVVMFPAAILFGLTELLVPELARCAAAGSKRRIDYLVSRSLRLALVYGAALAGLLFLLSDALCIRLYRNLDAAAYIRRYALLSPMLYCDAVTDAMTKGLGQQRVCVRYNIFTSALDVAFLYILLPRFGMTGYFVSFFVTHLINFALSLHRLLQITGKSIPLHVPAGTAATSLFAIWASSHLSGVTGRVGAYLLLLGSLLFLLRVLGREDIAWLRGLVRADRTKICPSRMGGV